MGFFFKRVGIAFKLVFHLNLQYPNLYLPLLTGMLGFHYNTYIRIYLYKLEFWGMIAILALVLTFTNWDFGAWLQYLHLYLLLPTGILGHDCNTCTCIYFYQLGFWGLLTILASNTDIIIILVFLHFTLFVLITWKQ